MTDMLDSDNMTLSDALRLMDEEDETNPEFFEAVRFAYRVLKAMLT